MPSKSRKGAEDAFTLRPCAAVINVLCVPNRLTRYKSPPLPQEVKNLLPYY
jgi:hypothetical protein